MESLEVLIPAHDESAVIAETVRRTVAELSRLRRPWRLTVLDNASEDGTAEAALAGAAGDDRVRVMGVPEPGKGNAVRAGLLASEADFALFMDADLSADLRHIEEFVEAMSGSCADMIVGSRLIAPAGVRRSALRTATSRMYNMAVRSTLGVPVRDTQCGFKLLRMSTMRPIVERVREGGWFFDTEMLALAGAGGLRVEERPIVWVEDFYEGRRGKLDLRRDAAAAVRAILRLRRRLG